MSQTESYVGGAEDGEAAAQAALAATRTYADEVPDPTPNTAPLTGMGEEVQAYQDWACRVVATVAPAGHMVEPWVLVTPSLAAYRWHVSEVTVARRLARRLGWGAPYLSKVA